MKCYTKACIENSFSSFTNLVSSIKEEQKFHYGKTDFQQFVKEYRSEGWIKRKIIAIPATVCVVVKAVCDLAVAILFGIPLAPFDGRKRFKAQIFHLCRDLQESFGRIISLVHDKYGLYHIEESQFQKTCYEIFCGNHIVERQFRKNCYKIYCGNVKQPPPLNIAQQRSHAQAPADTVVNPSKDEGEENHESSTSSSSNHTPPAKDIPSVGIKDLISTGSITLVDGCFGHVTADYKVDLKNIIAKGVISKHGTIRMDGGKAENVRASDEVYLENTNVNGAVISQLGSVQMEGGNAANVKAFSGVYLKSTNVVGNVSSDHETVKMMDSKAANVMSNSEVDLKNTDITGNVTSRYRTVKMVDSKAAKVHAENIDLQSTNVSGDVTAQLGLVKMVDGSAENVRASDEVHLENTNVNGAVISQLRSVKMVGGSAANVNGEHGVHLESTNITGDVTSRLKTVKMVDSKAANVKAFIEVDLKNTDITGNVTSRCRTVKMVGGSAENVEAKKSVKMQNSSARKVQVVKILDNESLNEDKAVVNLEKSTVNSVEITVYFKDQYNPGADDIIIHLNDAHIKEEVRIISKDNKLLSIKISGTGKISGNIILERSDIVVQLDKGIEFLGESIRP